MLQVLKALLVPRDLLVHKVILVRPEQLVHKAPRDLLVLRARLVLLEQLVGI